MEYVIGMSLWSACFALAHVGITTQRIRRALVGRFGEHGFALFNALISISSFSGALLYYNAHAEHGPRLDLVGSAHMPALAWSAASFMTIGWTFMITALAPQGYSTSPYRRGAGIRPPKGLHRVTRHPFFVGVVLFAGGHVLVAHTLVGAIYFGTLALLALLGPLHQDRKLSASLGPEFRAFLATTSFIPFQAIIRGRQKLRPSELPWPAIAIASASAIAVRALHGTAFAERFGPWLIIGVLTVLPAFFIIAGLRKQARA